MLFINNHQFYYSVFSIRPVGDKRLRTEITLLNEIINKKGITKISWTEDKCQIAGRFTKYGVIPEKLLNIANELLELNIAYILSKEENEGYKNTKYEFIIFFQFSITTINHTSIIIF